MTCAPGGVLTALPRLGVVTRHGSALSRRLGQLFRGLPGIRGRQGRRGRRGRGGDGVVVGLAELGHLGVGVVEPVGGPEPVEAPAEPLQVLLAQPVAVADAAGVPVGRLAWQTSSHGGGVYPLIGLDRTEAA
jgi:hypothetical protein